MEYTVNRLARLSGVSPRTLRYYDQIGLLAPARVNSSGYRIYGPAQVDLLQQILFFRALGVGLDDIRQMLDSPQFDREQALRGHLTALLQRREQLDLLIDNVQKTLCSMKGEILMSDFEKFEGLKQRLVDENERKYGQEIREKYGDETVDASNQKLLNMTPEQAKQAEELSAAIQEALREAVASGNPAGEAAQRACDLHRQWLCLYWPDGHYSKEAHLGLADMYCADARFAAYYEAIAPGAAEFLRDALKIYCR